MPVQRTYCLDARSHPPTLLSFHSVQFEDNGVKFWEYFNVGSGQFIPYSELTFHSGLEVISAFSTMESVIEKPKQMSKKRKDREICNIQFFPISGCISFFESEMEFLQHLAGKEHKFKYFWHG